MPGLAAAAGTGGGEQGKLFTQAFTPAEYGGAQQIWDVVQDRLGVVYAANDAGVVEFDGARWRTIDTGSEVRSLAVAADGTIFVGATGGAGYLRRNASGTTEFVSLLDRAPVAVGRLGRLRQAVPVGGDVYFRDHEHLLRWRPHRGAAGGGEARLQRLGDGEAVTTLEHLGHVAGRLLVAERHRGLLELREDRLRPLAGGERLAGRRVRGILELDGSRLLICTADSGLYVMADRDARPWPTPASRFASQGIAVGCSRLSDGRLVVTTLRRGLAFFDDAGEILRIVDSSSGLPDDGILNAAFEDREGGVWLPLQFGLARIEPASGLEVFDRTHGLGGSLTAIARHRGRLLVGSTQGLFSLQPADSPLARARFAAAEEIQPAVWDLLRADGRLLAATTRGVFEVQHGRTPRRLIELDARSLAHGGGRTYVGTRRDGLHSLVRRDGAWRDEGRLGTTTDDVRRLAVGPDGRVWLLGMTPAGAARIERVDPAGGTPAAVFGPMQGLEGDVVSPLVWRGEVWVATRSALYRFDPLTERFAQDLEPTAGLPYQRFEITSPRVHQGSLWFFTAPGGGALVRASGSGPPRVIRAASRIHATSVFDLLAEEQGEQVWVATGDGRLIRARGILDRTILPVGATLIRDVEVKQPEGSTSLAAGSGRRGMPVLPFTFYSLRIRYALPRFEAAAAHLYQSRLLGLDSRWSGWSDETYRDFTALREGAYRFEVRGRDVYGIIGEPATFDFRILPPWQRTWWAYALYAVVLAAAISGIVTWRLRDSRRRVLALAREIEERERMTERIERANRELERGERERTRFIAALEARNREMEGFVYTVSHDLKSPLVTISGFLGILERDLADGEASRVREDIERIRTAVGRLHDNLKGLLELSRLGLSVGEPTEFGLGPLASEAAEAHAVQLGRRKTEIEIAPDLPTVFGDRARLLGVLRNLIDNAIKFGPARGGRIRITAASRDGETTVAVSDNGIGIDARYHTKIFGIFDRLDPRTEGTGIGLAHARRTIEAHGGRLWVESEGLGCGSTFCFTLPARAASPLSSEEAERAAG